MFGLGYRDLLPTIVLDELERLVAALTGFLRVEHNEDGTHGDITALSLTTDSIIVENIVFGAGASSTFIAFNLTYDTVGAVWNLDDISKPGAVLVVSEGTFTFYSATAGVNPRTLLQILRINEVGAVAAASGLVVNGAPVPTSGLGTELHYDVLNGYGGLLAFNRTAGTYLPARIDGLTVALATGGTVRGTAHASGGLSWGNAVDPGISSVLIDLLAFIGPSNGAVSSARYHALGFATGADFHVTGSRINDLTVSSRGGAGIVLGTHPTAANTPIGRVWIHASGGVSIGGTTDIGAGNFSAMNSGIYTSDGVAVNFAYNDNVDDGTGYINFRGYQGGTTRFRDLSIRDGKTAEIAFFDGSSKETTLRGGVIVSGTSYPKLNIASSGVNGGVLQLTSSTNDWQIYNQGGNLLFHDGGAARLTLHDSGGVSIGDATDPGATNLRVAGTSTLVGAVNITSSLQCDSIVNDTGLASGVWTPTINNGTNAAASTAEEGSYLRVGNSVTASVKISVDPTAAGLTTVTFTLPIASAFTNNRELSGTGASIESAGAVVAEPVTDVAEYTFPAVSGTNLFHRLIFSYRVL